MSVFTLGSARIGAIARSRIGMGIAGAVAVSAIAVGGMAFGSMITTQAGATTSPVTVTCHGGTSIPTDPVSTIFDCQGSSLAAKTTSTGLVSAGTGAAAYIIDWTNGKTTDWFVTSGSDTPRGTCPKFLGKAATSGTKDSIEITGGTARLTRGVSGTLETCDYPFGPGFVETISSFTV